MSKQKKKRNKQYRGSGAVSARPEITRVTAVRRNRLQLWWLEHKRVAKPVAIASGIGLAVFIIVYELFRLFL